MEAAGQYDVIVVGCGPVGALAANLLGRSGLRCLVLEESDGLHPLPRAVHIDHEMMRILQSVGLAETLRATMREAQGNIHIGADGGVIRYLGTAGRPRVFGWANDYFFYQPEFEAGLRQGLSRYDHVTLRLGSRVFGLTQERGAVTVAVQELSGPVRYTASYVIACDGARSTVRKALKIDLDDLQFEEPWLVVDADVEGPISFPQFAGVPSEADLQQLSVMICDPSRPSTIVPGRGRHRRWEFMLLPEEREHDIAAAESVRSLLAPWVKDVTHSVIRAATYRFHGLVAEQWRAGRVFLAGDAAHQTPPFFGQGMCHGMRDVSNLVWKLSLVLTGKAPIALLDTYQQEREPQVRAVIGLAVEAGRYICQLDPGLAAKRDTELRAAAHGPAAAGAPAPDIIPPYRHGVVHSSGGQRFIQPKVRGADGATRLLDDATGGGFVLLRRDGSDLSDVAQRVVRTFDIGCFALDDSGGAGTLHDIDGDLGAWLDGQGADAVLLRPDAYVYGVTKGDQLDALMAALAIDLGLDRPEPPLEMYTLCTV